MKFSSSQMARPRVGPAPVARRLLRYGLVQTNSRASIRLRNLAWPQPAATVVARLRLVACYQSTQNDSGSEVASVVQPPPAWPWIETCSSRL